MHTKQNITQQWSKREPWNLDEVIKKYTHGGNRGPER